MDIVTQSKAVLGPDSPFLEVARTLDELVFVWRPSGEMLWVNDAFVRVTGMTCDDFKFRNADNPFIPPEDLPRVLTHISAFLETSDLASTPIENRFCDAWGAIHVLSTILYKVTWLGTPALLLVSKRKLDSPEALRAAQDAQRRLMDSIGDGVLELSAQGCVTFSNRVVQSWLHARPVELVRCHLSELLHPDVHDKVQQAMKAVLGGMASAHFEATLRGAGRELDIKLSPIAPDCGKSVALAIIRDITGLRTLERSLQHNQRLESIGRLAGGVAHDFNNTLTTIGGNIALVLSDLPESSPLRQMLYEAQSAAESAATLTTQLLAFSRRQVIAPKVLALNDVIHQMQRILERLLGDNITLKLQLEPQLAPIQMDLGQLEQILVNLCVNARDAMPEGGTLTIATSTVPRSAEFEEQHPTLGAQRVLCMTVTDTGAGISEEVREHIFEPFFTTKEPAKGTGLGLAMVYGAMQQNGGCVDVESLSGAGTTFRLYFPGSQVPADSALTSVSSTRPQGDETIVLVEDEAMVRTVAQRILSRMGYTVWAYASPAEALDDVQARASTAGTRPAIDLLVTDMVMPNMDGRELAERMRSLQPGLRVLFTSGYAQQMLARSGELPAGFEFLPKPYSSRTLAERVGKLLARPQ